MGHAGARAVEPSGRARDAGAPFRPILRERIVDRLRAASHARVTAIIAPAGFGKTVAMRQFLARSRGAVRFDVPAEATALAPFVRAFAEALSDAVPDLERTVGTALAAARGSTQPGETLAAWAGVHLRRCRLVIAIDDLHAGNGDPQIAAFLRKLVAVTDDDVRFIVSSRTTANLPFASWTVYGVCDVPLDAEDLKLTADEALRCAGAAATESEVLRTLEWVGGWPTAFAFALHSRGRGHAVTADAGRDMVYQYLAEQVWSALDERLRLFLRDVSFLPRLELPVCIAAGYDDALALIEALRDRATFVTKAGDDVYALHDLFRDFVRHEVRRSGEAAGAAAWTRAARALIATGRVRDGAQALIRARDPVLITAFLSEHGLGFADRGELDVVEQALQLVGEDDGGGPVIAALRGMCAEARGAPGEAQRHFRAALAGTQALATPLAVDVANKVAVFHARYDRGDALATIRLLKARTDLNDAQHAVLCDLEAVSLTMTDRLDEAIPAIRRALELIEAPGMDADTRSKVYANAGIVLYHAGDEAAARTYGARAIEGSLACGNHRRAAAVSMNLYLLHSGAGRAAESARWATRAADEAEKAGDVEYRGTALRAALKVAAERGDDAEIERLRAVLRDLPRPPSNSLIYEMIALTLVHGAAGRLDDAREALEAVPEADFVAVQNRTRYALLALVHAARGARRDGEEALARYRAFGEATSLRRAVFHRSNALSDRWAVLAVLRLHGRVRAREALAAALAAPPDLVPLDDAVRAAIARDDARFARSVAALERDGKAGYARFVAALASSAAAPEPAGLRLTAAERRILEALADGLSNQAIADRHHRSVNTVRTQVASLLRKLGVSSRGEAVALARRFAASGRTQP